MSLLFCIYIYFFILCDIYVGFVWDRQWVVINSKGRGYTQRVEPKLALVQVELPVEAFSFGWEPNNSSYLGIFFFHPHICVSVDKKKTKRRPIIV
ncbi:hypothetical protein Hanom_Chr10g00893101 [Helianthus anomalus]